MTSRRLALAPPAPAARPGLPLWPAAPAYRGHPLFSAGHRVFFLFTGLWASLALPVWLAAWRGLLPLDMRWHAHEMLFGFAGAAIAGFLLAAVPKWTSTAPLQGAPVKALAGVWLLARVSAAFAWPVPLDALFFPALAFTVAQPIVRTRNSRNYGVVAVLAGLAALDLATHFGDPTSTLRAAVILVASLIAIIAGRIVPSFTQNALRLAGDDAAVCTTPPALDRASVPASLLALAAGLLAPGSRIEGAALAVAGLVAALRMRGWRTRDTLRMPIVWSLHAGYAFLPLGFLLMAWSSFGGPVAPIAALHALSAGAIGVMILAVASRAALGHSGRKLEAPPAVVAAYVLASLGALARVSLTGVPATLAAGAAWSLAFLLFTWVYAPILTRPRIDGQPG